MKIKKLLDFLETEEISTNKRINDLTSKEYRYDEKTYAEEMAYACGKRDFIRKCKEKVV